MQPPPIPKQNYGPLQTLMQDESVSEIMVNNYASVFVERAGQLEKANSPFQSEQELQAFLLEVAKSTGRELSSSQPFMDSYLADGSRVNAVLPPMAPKGANLTIRKFRRTPYTLEDYINIGTVSHKAAFFIHAAVRARLNVIVSGGTGTGKTTFLNTVSSLIPPEERIVSIEDIAELNLQHPNWVRLESVYRNNEANRITTKDCLVNALRMRPDRIIVGECRRDETFEMLQAMNTGHEGSLTTIHANSSRDCLTRIESLILSSNIDAPLPVLRKQISSAVDLIIQLSRSKAGKRVVTEIVEITGVEQGTITTQTLFSTEKTKSGSRSTDSELMVSGFTPTIMGKFSDAGIQFQQNFFDPNQTNFTYRPD